MVKEAVEHGADRVVLDMDSARVRFMASKRAAPITGTSSRSATIHCLCSTVTGTAWRRSCDPATCTAPKTGTGCRVKPFENLTGLGCRAICDLTEGLSLRLWKMEIPT